MSQFFTQLISPTHSILVVFIPIALFVFFFFIHPSDKRLTKTKIRWYRKLNLKVYKIFPRSEVPEYLSRNLHLTEKEAFTILNLHRKWSFLMLSRNPSMSMKVLNRIAEENKDWFSVRENLLKNPATTDEAKVFWTLQWGVE